MSGTTARWVSRALGCREQARQARRLALEIASDEQEAQFLRLADQLDRAAARLEEKAAASAGRTPVTVDGTPGGARFVAVLSAGGDRVSTGPAAIRPTEREHL
jgi:hypothetical protein